MLLSRLRSDPHRTAVGLAFVLFPILVQVPFNLLAISFDYPDILREGAGEVLPRFHAGGRRLLFEWYAYALLVVPLLVAILALPRALDARGSRLLEIATGIGAVSGAAQLIGLLRWTFAVPLLASRWVAAGDAPATREAIAIAYDTQHALLGVLLGEHVGQLTLALWTAGVSLWLWREVKERWLAAVGLASAAAFLLGLGDGLATVEALPRALHWMTEAPLVAFLAWTVWCVWLGVRLLRGLPPLRDVAA